MRGQGRAIPQTGRQKKGSQPTYYVGEGLSRRGLSHKASRHTVTGPEAGRGHREACSWRRAGEALEEDLS